MSPTHGKTVMNTPRKSPRYKKLRNLIASSAILAATVACAPIAADTSSQSQSAEEQEKPNILMVLIDDLGYTDIGAYGGEAETPNMDELADNYLQLSNAHAYPSCAPSRATLMTGQDPHRVGLGSQSGFTPPGVPSDTPGYSGSLEGEYRGVADVLGEAGYTNYQVGKWHLGSEEGQTPHDLGFDENFTLYDSHASHYSDAYIHTPRLSGEPRDKAMYERNGEAVDELPEDFYSTHAYTDEMIEMIGDGEAEEPFFGYLAYTAVHDPLHVPDEERIEHYLEIYREQNNYEQLRSDRIERLADLGLISEDVEMRWPDQVDDWADVPEERRDEIARRMAVYSAMVEDVDTQVGRLLDHLRDIDEYDNTLIVVASDNGAAGPGRHLYTAPHDTRDWQDEHYPLVDDVEAFGQRGSYPTLSLPNAQVSSGPFFHSKLTVFEGGTRVPMVVKPPHPAVESQSVNDTFVHLADLYPTFADYAGIHLEEPELLGDSARDLFEGKSEEVGSDEFGMEYLGSRAYRSGDWKIVYTPTGFGGTGDWALYDLSTDIGEVNDLSDEHPEVLEELATAWDEYAEVNGVVPVPIERMNEEDNLSEMSFAHDWVN